ncbi:MAG: DUF4288 domain-containing protein [Thermomonas sp.]
MDTDTKQATQRFAAKLLFQFRVMIGDDPGKRRLCEERIVLIEAASAKAALAEAKRIGKKARQKYKNTDGNDVYFEFVGILDLMHLGVECEPNEVWYDIKEMPTPMERAGKILPKEKDLSAIRNSTRF